jgi:hypothetical protein
MKIKERFESEQKAVGSRRNEGGFLETNLSCTVLYSTGVPFYLIRSSTI